MAIIADILIDRFLVVVNQILGLNSRFEPFKTIVYGYDKDKKFHSVKLLKPAIVSLMTRDEMLMLRDSKLLYLSFDQECNLDLK